MSHAQLCRALAAGAKTATLSTLNPGGYPYGSLVAVAFDDRGRPLLLLSQLAEHTTNLLARPQASILVHEAASEQPLAAGRMTILGKMGRADEARDAYLAQHPEAAEYAGFRDFAFYRLEPESIRYVGGFGRMSWVDVEEYSRAT
jgi:hypothetical protein